MNLQSKNILTIFLLVCLWFQVEIKAQKEILNVSKIADSLIVSGESLEKDLKYAKAILEYTKAYKILEKDDFFNIDISKNSFFHLIDIYSLIQQPSLEAFYLSEFISLAEKRFNGDEDHIWALLQLAFVYSNMNRYEESRALLRKVEVLDPASDNNPTIALNYGFIYQNEKHYDEAEKYFIKACDLFEQIDSAKNSQCLNYLAMNFFYAGKLEDARNIIIESLSICENEAGKSSTKYSSTLNTLACIVSKMKNYSLADSLFDISLNILESKSDEFNVAYSHILCNAAKNSCYADNFSKAFIYLSKAHTTRQDILKKSIANLSNSETSTYSEVFKKDLLNNLSFIQNNPKISSQYTPLLFNQSLFYKGFALTAATRVKCMASNNPVSASIFKELGDAQRFLSQQYAKPKSERNIDAIIDYEKKANALEKELARSVPDYEEAIKPVTWQEVQTHLSPDAAAIEFVDFPLTFPNENSDSVIYAVLVLRPGDAAPHYVPLCEARQLAHLLETQGKLSKNNLYAFQPDSPSLYELIWKPLASLLNGVNTVYFSPSGELHRLNLAAIMEPSGEVLGSRFTFNQLLSTRQLAEKNTPPTAAIQPEAVVFGGINYDADSTALSTANQQMGLTDVNATRGYLAYADSTAFAGTWRYLPGTQKEVNNIAETLHAAGYKVVAHTDNKGTEEAFKNTGKGTASPRIIHAATHGYFFPDPTTTNKSTTAGNEPAFKVSEHPLIRSGLILAGGNIAWANGRPAYEGAEDGILTAHEVSQMNLSNTALVVLSACDTGLGDIKGNEGVYGLQRAFHIAGAKYILMSLWKVSDKATGELMTRFYQHWLSEQLPIESAFRKAQNELRNMNDDPAFWAGFVLVKG